MYPYPEHGLVQQKAHIPATAEKRCLSVSKCYSLKHACTVVAIAYSLGIFGRAVDGVNAQCVCNFGLGYLTRPDFSLHFLLINPVSNLHLIFNPKYSLLFLKPSLWSGA